MTVETISRAAERDLSDMQAAYEQHRAEHNGPPCNLSSLLYATCQRCASFRDHIARCQLQLELLSGSDADEQPELF